MNIATQYDKDQKEIEELMLRFIPSYMEDLYRGMYVTPQHTEQSLRNIFRYQQRNTISMKLCHPSVIRWV